MNRNTVVINLFAGPGAGKSTAAWEIASELKKRGYIAEYVPEYAKELVWDKNFEKLDGSYENQCDILREQSHRVERLIGQVDFVVCDSPIMINASYLKGTEEEKEDYEKKVYSIFSKYNNFSIFINREKKFEQAGRMQNLEESRKLDSEIKNLMEKFQIYYGSYFGRTIHLAIDNCIYTYNRINTRPSSSHQREAEAEETEMQKQKAEAEPKQINENSEHIEVDGHQGSWYVVDMETIGAEKYYLVENEQYGDEAENLILDEDGNLVLNQVYNGFDDLKYFLQSKENEEYDEEMEL